MDRQAVPVCLPGPKIMVCILPAVLTLAAADVRSRALPEPSLHVAQEVLII